MSVARWSAGDALAAGPLVIDSVDGATILVIDEVSAADDAGLEWCRRAPFVVVGLTRDGAEPSGAVDVSLEGGASAELQRLVERASENPAAARTLVDVLRIVPNLDVHTALVVESLAYSMLLAGPEFAAWLSKRSERRHHDSVAPPVRLERQEDELHVTLSRPENRNAFSAAMRDALFEALTVAEMDETIATVVLAADGPCFSSGGDLTEFGTAPDVVRAHQVRTLRSVGAVLSRIAPRVTARVHGPCVGAGVELSAFAGRVVALPDTTFRLPEIAMGLIPGAGGTVSLSRRIGRQATARVALLGEEIDTAEALQLGLVDELA